MKLGHKNLVYSLVLACILLLFLVGYFIYMLPSLYVDHIMEQNLRSIREQHRSYAEKHSYEEVQAGNPSACFSIEIPSEGDRILIAGKMFTAEILIRDRRLGEILERWREKADLFGEGETGQEKGQDIKQETGRESEQEAQREPEQAPGLKTERETEQETEQEIEQEIELIGEIFREALEDNRSLPVELKILNGRSGEELYFGETVKYHYYSGNLIIVEAGISDDNNHYTNYLALEEKDGGLILSFLPVVTPQMDEIRPVVLQSLPMLAAVILLLVLLFSGMYSRGMVTPVVELVRRTEEMKEAGEFSGLKSFGVERRRKREERSGRKDEIGRLADTLEDFYLQIRKGYRELEEENRRQEIFLRASSHQLKTPVAAALLLVEGMINEVGRYKDRSRYLPGVKEQLLSMKKIVEDILYLNHCADNMQPVEAELGEMTEERLRAYQIMLTEKGIRTEFEKGKKVRVWADEGMLLQILDNLLSNAVKYTPEGGRIRILLWEEAYEETGGFPAGTLRGGFSGSSPERVCGIRIENFGVTIPEELLPHVTEPFVSGRHKAEGTGMFSHGLGLYIAAYYAGKLGAELSVANGKDSVIAELKFHSIFI